MFANLSILRSTRPTHGGDDTQHCVMSDWNRDREAPKNCSSTDRDENQIEQRKSIINESNGRISELMTHNRKLTEEKDKFSEENC